MKKFLLLLFLFIPLRADAQWDYMTKTLAAYQTKVAFDDSFDANVARDVLLMRRADMNDTLNVRLYGSFPLFWSMAWADSMAANDSLTVEIANRTPIGDVEALFIHHALGVVEKIALYLDFQLPNQLAILDSIVVPIWTETTNATDYVSFSAWDDSSTLLWKSKMTKGVDDSMSSTARTTKSTRIPNIALTGGRIRLKGLVNAVNDSMFVGMPMVYVRNP